MADYVVRVEAASSEAEQKLKRIERQISNIDRDVKVNIQLPSLQQTTSALQTFGQTAAQVGVQALDLSRKLNVGPGAVLNDLEDLFGKVAKKGEQTISVFQALSQATPTRIIGTSFDIAAGSVDRFSKQVANLGFVLFGVTQSVNVLKQAFGGFFDETIGREIRLQESLLRTKTTLISTADVVRNGQRLTDPFQALAALEKPIDKTLENIRRRSLDIAGTTSDAIVQVFGVVASQIGAIGGSLKDAEDLAITFAGALGTIGMADPMLANQEIRSILTGNIDQNSVLARSLGITNEEIARAKRSSEGLVAYLTKRLEGFGAGQKLAAQGFAGITSNIQEVREEATRSFGKPLLEPLLASLTTVYERLSLIFDQILAISTNAGRAASNLASGLLYGMGQAPVLQRITPETQGRAADQLAESTKNFAANVEREIDRIRPLITRITNEIIIAIARITQGLGALIQGFTYFKFEQLKVVATTFANMAAVLNATVVPALQAMLNLYGQLLQLPIVNYITQVVTVHEALERIGVNSIVRLAATWKFYQESINTAIGWVKTASSTISNAVKGTLNFIAGGISALGVGFETVLTKIINAATQGLIFLIQAVSSGVQQLGVLISKLGITLQRQFKGTPLAALGVALRDVGRAFMNVDRQVAITAQRLRDFGVQATQSLEVVRQKTDQAAASVRTLGQTIGTALTTGLQKLGGALRGILVGFLKFQAFLIVSQAVVAAATESFGRYQRAKEQAANTRRTDEAIRKLSTTYKDLGDNIDEATKRDYELQQQLLETRYTQNQQDIAALTEKIEKLKSEMDAPGIQSWGELMRNVFVNPITAIQVLIDRFRALRESLSTTGQFWQSVFARINDSISTVTSNEGFQRWIVATFPALTTLIAIFKMLADAIGAVVNRLDELSKRRLLAGAMDALPMGRAGRAVAQGVGALWGARQSVVDEVNQRNLSEDEKARQAMIDEQNRINALRDREREEENTRLAAKARQDAMKELKEYERQLDKQLFDERQSLARKELELYRAAETFRIEQIDRANAKKIEGEEGASAAALAALNEYISTKEKHELELATNQRELALELADLDRKVVDYRHEMEKRIADIRMKAAQYDAQVTAAAAAGAYTSGGATSSGVYKQGGYGPGGPNAYGHHHDIARVDGGYFSRNALDRYVQVDGRPLSEGHTVPGPTGGRFGASRDGGTREHRAWDYAFAQGKGDLTLTGGAQWVSSTPGQYGDRAEFVTPDGTRYRIIHGKLQGAQFGDSSNMAGYLKRLSYLETGIKNVPNAQGSGAEGFFQTKPAFHGEARIASGGKNSRSANYDEAAAAVEAWIKMHRPVAYHHIQRGEFDKADAILRRGTWPSLPGGSQARDDATQAKARQFLTAGGGAPAGVPAPPDLSGGDYSKAKALGESIIAVQNNLKELLKREAELKKQIAEANNAAQLETIAKALFPTVPLEQFKNAQLELEKSLELTAQYAGLAHDPERLAIAVDLTTRRAIAERELTEFEKKQNELLKGTKVTEEEKKKIQDQIAEKQRKFNEDLAEEEKYRLKILDLQRKSQAVLQLASDKRGILFDTRNQIFEASTASAGLNLEDDDFLGRRTLDARRTLFQKRLELEQKNLSPEAVQTYLDALEPVVMQSAEALATLDETADELAERLSLVKESTNTLIQGYKGFLSSVLSGGDIKEAAAQMSQNIAGRFVDMMLDYAFKPVEKQIEAMFRELFNVDEAEEANTNAIKTLTTKFEELTRKLGELTQALNSPATTSYDAAAGAPDPTAQSYSGVTPGGTPFVTGSATATSVDPSIAAVEQSYQAFQTSTANLAKGVQESAKETTEGTDEALTGMQKYATGLASVATAALSIVGGVQQIKEGGTANVLGGIGSIFLGLGGALGGFGSFFKGKASGGDVSANTPYIVGEKGPELFTPNRFGSITPNNRLRSAMGTPAGSRPAGTALTEFRFQTEVINRTEYVSVAQLDRALNRSERRSIAGGARRGEESTFDRLVNSPRSRSLVGLR